MEQLDTTENKQCTVWNDYVPIIVNEESKHTSVFLTKPITYPEYYDKLIYMLETASKNDKFTIYINTPGGSVDTAIAIRNAIKGSDAKVIAVLSGSVVSAGTIIALSCNEIIVKPNLLFIAHKISIEFEDENDFTDLHTVQTYYREQANKLVEKVYRGFLSTDEIQSMNSGSEICLTTKEVQQRWLDFKSTKEL